MLQASPISHSLCESSSFALKTRAILMEKYLYIKCDCYSSCRLTDKNDHSLTTSDDSLLRSQIDNAALHSLAEIYSIVTPGGKDLQHHYDPTDIAIRISHCLVTIRDNLPVNERPTIFFEPPFELAQALNSLNQGGENSMVHIEITDWLERFPLPPSP